MSFAFPESPSRESKLPNAVTGFRWLPAVVLALASPCAECDAQLIWDISVASGIQGGSGNWLGGPTWSYDFRRQYAVGERQQCRFSTLEAALSLSMAP